MTLLLYNLNWLNMTIRVISLAVAMLLALTSCAQDSAGYYGTDCGGHAAVVAPKIPDSATFAGETLRLDRYDLRERMDRELISFCYMHSSTLLIIKRANRYFPVVEPILKECGVPDDFKYLMAIESSLLVQTVSPAGAAGLWQFMESTGREYGLEVNSNVDERFNVEKSTRAACAYLKEAYARYGDWWSVAAAYNAGQGRITRELERQGENSALDLWLNTETSRYMFRIMALKTIMESPQEYGFRLTPAQLYPPLAYDTVSVTTGIVSLSEWAAQHGVSYYQLKDANRWFRGSSLINKSGKKYDILIIRQESAHYDPEATVPHNPAWCR